MINPLGILTSLSNILWGFFIVTKNHLYLEMKYIEMSEKFEQIRQWRA